MTGTTTQVMIDLADLLRGSPPDARAATLARVRTLSATMGSFAAGAAAAAMLFHWLGPWCFALPPAVAVATLMGHGIAGSRSLK